jgi:hypothetical protein
MNSSASVQHVAELSGRSQAGLNSIASCVDYDVKYDRPQFENKPTER